MASKCKQKNQIDQQVVSCTMRCHRHNRDVEIVIDLYGNRCVDGNCAFSQPGPEPMPRTNDWMSEK